MQGLGSSRERRFYHGARLFGTVIGIVVLILALLWNRVLRRTGRHLPGSVVWTNTPAKRSFDWVLRVEVDAKSPGYLPIGPDRCCPITF